MRKEKRRIYDSKFKTQNFFFLCAKEKNKNGENQNMMKPIKNQFFFTIFAKVLKPHSLERNDYFDMKSPSYVG